MTASPVELVTRVRAPLMRYVTAAVLARLGDAGAGLSLVLLSVDRLGTRGAAVGGVLAAALTAPHVFGNWTGRLVDRARDPRRALAFAGSLYAAALLIAIAVFVLVSPWSAVPPLVVAGACGPLLTGGLSSLASGLHTPLTRARSLDVLTYGVAGSAGPALVAVLADVASPVVAAVGVAVGVVVASWLFVSLPDAGTNGERTDGASHRGSVLLTSRPLRRVLVTTVPSAAAGGALAVVAVVRVGELTGQGASGAWVLVAVGVGNLLGSTVLVARPLHVEPVRASLAFAAALAVGYLLVAAAPTFALVLAAGAVVGLLTAPWVTSTLSARELHAPPGRRAEVFTALAGWKIAAAAAGTAVAGVLVQHSSAQLVMAGLAVLSILAVVVAAYDRR